MATIKQKYLKQIKDDSILCGKLSDATGKSIWTIHRWIDDNDEMLTLAAVLKVVKEHLKISPKVDIVNYTQKVQHA